MEDLAAGSLHATAAQDQQAIKEERINSPQARPGAGVLSMSVAAACHVCRAAGDEAQRARELLSWAQSSPGWSLGRAGADTETPMTAARVRSLMLMVACAALSGRANAEPPPPQAAIPARWQKYEHQFAPVGFDTTYSCEGIKRKLKALLLAAGARDDLVIVPSGPCNVGRPNALASVHVTFYALKPVPANSRGGAVKPEAYGEFRSVTISPRAPGVIGPGDCRLIQDFRHELLPSFVTRAVDDRSRCTPHEPSRSSIYLSFQSLRAR